MNSPSLMKQEAIFTEKVAGAKNISDLIRISNMVGERENSHEYLFLWVMSHLLHDSTTVAPRTAPGT